MERFDFLVLITRWVHLAAAIVAIGGAAFARLALHPALRETLDEPTRDRLHEALRRRWLGVVMTCIVLLLLTGGINFAVLVLHPRVEPMPYHAVFGLKFLAALLVFFVASALVGRSPATEAMRRQRGKWLSVILVAAAVVVLLSGVLNQVRATSARRTSPPAANAASSTP